MELSFDQTSNYLLIAAICCFLGMLYLFFYKKNYTAAAHSWGLLGFGLGAANINLISFAVFYSLISCLVIVFLIVLNRHKRPEKRKKTKKVLFLTVLLVILLLKILLDTLLYGLDEFRSQSLYTSLVYVFIPLAVLLLNISLKGIKVTLAEFVYSSLILYTIVLLVILPSIVQTQLFPAIFEGHRITVFDADTINSCRLFTYTTIFPYCAYMFFPNKKLVRYFLIGIIALSVILIILNGTRQFLLAVIVAFIFSSIKSLNFKKFAVITVLIVAGVYLYNVYSDKLENVTLVSRLDSESLHEEATQSRGLIWAIGFSKMFKERPITGLGFRNYGTYVYMSDLVTGKILTTKDNAHGFYQEVFIEHGMILGILVVLATLHTIYILRTKLARYDIRFRRIVISTCIILIVPLLFSGSILNGLGVYYLAIVTNKL